MSEHDVHCTCFCLYNKDAAYSVARSILQNELQVLHSDAVNRHSDVAIQVTNVDMSQIVF